MPDVYLELIVDSDGVAKRTTVKKKTSSPQWDESFTIYVSESSVLEFKAICKAKGIEVVHVADAPLHQFKGMGCGCATMSRNDPPHLVAILDLLRQGKAPAYNIVQPGDVVNEFTGQQIRLDPAGQRWIVDNAKIALENMIRITENR